MSVPRAPGPPGGLTVQVRLLGPFSVVSGGRAAGPWPRPSARRLCQLVLVSPGRRVSRDLACEELFPGLDPRAAARSVSKALSMARATLAELGPAAAALLAADLSHIWASPAAEVDAEGHEQALRAALAMEPGHERDGRLAAALAEEGELLADEPYADWALRPGERLAALRQEARLALARDRAKGAGESGPEAVLAAWQACFEHDPASEEAAGALVGAYFAHGHRDLAVRAYERCRAALAELGLGVSPWLEEVYATAAVEAVPSRSAPAPPPAAAAREELRTVSVLAAEVAAPQDDLDPESLHDLIGRGLTAVIAEVEALGGTVTSVSGQGLQAMFGAPEAHEDDLERAARAAFRALSAVAAIDGARPALRIGVETGPAVLGPIGGGARVEYGAVGEVVGRAAALQSAARPGSALVAPVTRAATGHLFTWGASEQVAAGPAPLTATYLGEPRPRAAGRRLGPGLPPGAALGRMSPGEVQRETFAAWRSLVSRLVAAAPAVLVLEDLHWADPTSLRLTLDLARLAAGRRLLVLATSRPDASPEVASLETSGLPVHPDLPRAAAGAGRAGARPVSHRRRRGPGGPGRRSGQRGRQSAVPGGEADLAAGNASPGARAGRLADQRDRGPAGAPGAGAPGPVPGGPAHPGGARRCPPRALRYFELAGDHATEAFANDEAVSSFRSALAVAGEDDAAVELQAKLANVLWRTGRREEAREAFRAALRLADGGDTVRRAHLHIRLGRLEAADARYEAAEEAFDAAEALLGQREMDAAATGEWLELVVDGRACQAITRREPEQALAMLAAVRPVLEAQGSPARKYSFYLHLALARANQNRFRVDETDLANVRLGLAAAAQGEEKDVGYATFFVGRFLWLHGDLADAQEYLERALAMAERIGESLLLAQSLLGLALTALRRHDTEAVRALVPRVLAESESMASAEYLAGAKACLAWLAWQDRRPDDVIKLSEEIATLAPALRGSVDVGCYHGLVHLWPLVAVHLDAGDMAEAVAVARRLPDYAQRLPGELEAAVRAASQAWDQGHATRAREKLAAALALARELNYC